MEQDKSNTTVAGVVGGKAWRDAAAGDLVSLDRLDLLQWTEWTEEPA